MRAGWADLYAWQVDRASGTPVFRQLYSQLRAAILLALPSGTRVPSTRALAARLGLARASVVSAYEQLHAEGYLSGRVGSGTFVSADLPERIELRAARRATRPAPPPRIPARARALEEAVESTAPSDPRPFGLGRCRVDARTVDAWRRLTHRAVRVLDSVHLGYSDARGLPALRETICTYLTMARAVRCAPEQIIVTAGTQQALDLAIRVLLGPGERAWVEDPGYPMGHAALAAAGVTVCPIPVDTQGLNVKAGIRAAPSARAAFVTPSNQYPLGVMLSMARRLELLEWARSSGAWIVEDDFDSELRYAGRPLASLQGLDDGERVIYIGTLNKVLFPGVRIGYAVVPPALLRAFVNARHLVDRHPPSLNQVVVTEFIRQGHFAAHLRRMRAAYREQRDALVSELGRRAGADLELVLPDHGMHLVAYLAPGRSDVALEGAARRQGVVVRALSRYYLAAPPRSGLILGFTGFPRESIVAAAGRLADVVRRSASPVGSRATRARA